MIGSNLYDLTGKVSVVTGAGSGFGRVFSLALGECGSSVVCADINEAWGEETAEMLAKKGIKALAVKTDVSRQESVKTLFEKVDQEFGKADVLFNNAGITTQGSRLHEMKLEDWNKVLAVDLTGVFLCMQEGIRMMLRQKSGSIINIASVLGLLGTHKDVLLTSHYVAAKHGVIGLTKSAAVQYGVDNIRVNAIAPGFFTGTRLGSVEPMTPEKERIFREKIRESTPMNRSGRPEELLGLAILLASDASSFITGETFAVDGGWCAW